jgi:hypothetical protein
MAKEMPVTAVAEMVMIHHMSWKVVRYRRVPEPVVFVTQSSQYAERCEEKRPHMTTPGGGPDGGMTSDV